MLMVLVEQLDQTFPEGAAALEHQIQGFHVLFSMYQSTKVKEPAGKFTKLAAGLSTPKAGPTGAQRMWADDAGETAGGLPANDGGGGVGGGGGTGLTRAATAMPPTADRQGAFSASKAGEGAGGVAGRFAAAGQRAAGALSTLRHMSVPNILSSLSVSAGKHPAGPIDRYVSRPSLPAVAEAGPADAAGLDVTAARAEEGTHPGGDAAAGAPPISVTPTPPPQPAPGDDDDKHSSSSALAGSATEVEEYHASNSEGDGTGDGDARAAAARTTAAGRGRGKQPRPAGRRGGKSGTPSTGGNGSRESTAPPSRASSSSAPRLVAASGGAKTAVVMGPLQPTPIALSARKSLAFLTPLQPPAWLSGGSGATAASAGRRSDSWSSPRVRSHGGGSVQPGRAREGTATIGLSLEESAASPMATRPARSGSLGLPAEDVAVDMDRPGGSAAPKPASGTAALADARAVLSTGSLGLGLPSASGSLGGWAWWRGQRQRGCWRAWHHPRRDVGCAGCGRRGMGQRAARAGGQRWRGRRWGQWRELGVSWRRRREK